jgi:hypothetical protein
VKKQLRLLDKVVQKNHYNHFYNGDNYRAGAGGSEQTTTNKNKKKNKNNDDNDDHGAVFIPVLAKNAFIYRKAVHL